MMYMGDVRTVIALQDPLYRASQIRLFFQPPTDEDYIVGLTEEEILRSYGNRKVWKCEKYIKESWNVTKQKIDIEVILKIYILYEYENRGYI